jgi:hypothetical protein
LGAHGVENGRGGVGRRTECIEELIAFFDVRCQVSNVELKPGEPTRRAVSSPVFLMAS